MRGAEDECRGTKTGEDLFPNLMPTRHRHNLPKRRIGGGKGVVVS